MRLCLEDKRKKMKRKRRKTRRRGKERVFERGQGTSWHFSWSMRHKCLSQATSQMSVPEILALSRVQLSPVGLARPVAGPWTWLFPLTAALQQVVAANLRPSCLRGYLITWSSLFASERTCHPLPAPPPYPTVICQSVVYTGSFPGLTTITPLQHPQMATLQGFIWLAIWLVS